ncbi:MAG: hypothetical protein DWQ05_20815 [Calditrichaeota bacterium]|nr:MAG: hypothetical protein DWQ05_20815 [Calditrichota bacterium]
MKNPIQLGAVAGVVYLISLLPELTLEVAASELGLDWKTHTLYILVHLVCMLSAILFYRAFMLMGTQYYNNSLYLGALMTLVTIIIYHGLKIVYASAPEDVHKIMGLGYLLVIGGSALVFGYGLMQLAGKFGSLAKMTGILEIITGITCVSVVLALFALILTVPVIVLEIMLLLRFKPEYLGRVNVEQPG